MKYYEYRVEYEASAIGWAWDIVEAASAQKAADTIREEYKKELPDLKITMISRIIYGWK